PAGDRAPAGLQRGAQQSRLDLRRTKEVARGARGVRAGAEGEPLGRRRALRLIPGAARDARLFRRGRDAQAPDQPRAQLRLLAGVGTGKAGTLLVGIAAGGGARLSLLPLSEIKERRAWRARRQKNGRGGR